MITFQSSWSLRKTFLGCELAGGFLKRFTSQRVRKRIYNFKCSKPNVLGKGKSEVYSGKACLNLVKLRGMLNPILINIIDKNYKMG